MPVVACYSCGRNLNVAERKMGTPIACPSCHGPAFGPRRSSRPSETDPEIAPHSTQCPGCGSDNCQRVQIVHDMGTSKSSGRALSTGGAGFAIGAALTSYSGTSQHLLAAACAPPRMAPANVEARSGVVTGRCASIVGLFLTFPGVIQLSDPTGANQVAAYAWLGVGSLTLGLGFCLVYLKQSRIQEEIARNAVNQQDFLVRWQEWQRKFICLKCGRVWAPQ